MKIHFLLKIHLRFKGMYTVQTNIRILEEFLEWSLSCLVITNGNQTKNSWCMGPVKSTQVKQTIVYIEYNSREIADLPVKWICDQKDGCLVST
jgi:hypothetical protein